MDLFWLGRRLLIGVSGGIAAYKTCALVSGLAQQGAEVKVVLTTAAEKFVSSLTFAALSRQPTLTDADFWQPTRGRPLHIELGEWAEAILIAPLSANTLAKLAHGLADNLLTNVILASQCPVALAPAMNTQMWQAQAVAQNWQRLQQDSRFWALPTASGRLACDAVGEGRLLEPEALQEYALALLWTKGQRDWQGKRVLISAGGTREPIDAVRFIGNPSSGRMGIALAVAAACRGASVTLVHGPLGIPFQPEWFGIQALSVETAAQLERVLTSLFPQMDMLWMAAAVGDVRPAQPFAGKLPKAQLPETLPLVRIPDVVAALSQGKRPQQRIIGFAAQTGDPLPPAQEKLHQKGLDAIVANPIDLPDSGFGSLHNQGYWIPRCGDIETILPCEKSIMAHRLLDLALRLG
ncbi:bifunctional phosphopantothenoylcysteine decarboxylase/phosphopantothenate--cysteine ligase CoaBC [Thermostichus vulcanus]|uniref:Coenzyme A biosynthesis bifunctional protein CoaBC n=1 Tax=Thermostichus vulcanus str. 'Rupite' TaxID=2813851 RepID=A0ABT0C8B6_THEVL|nr:bifunctional phosphopantothenoylcysteine decarboxylase/phosphopantothenate--cysteine ligase CoaBC [Thermostichus vulcanus str. 'Rupite']